MTSWQTCYNERFLRNEHQHSLLLPETLMTIKSGLYIYTAAAVYINYTYYMLDRHLLLYFAFILYCRHGAGFSSAQIAAVLIYLLAVNILCVFMSLGYLYTVLQIGDAQHMSCVYYRPYYRQCLLLSELLFSPIYGEMICYIENILFEPRLYIFAIEMPASPFDEKHRVLYYITHYNSQYIQRCCCWLYCLTYSKERKHNCWLNNNS